MVVDPCLKSVLEAECTLWTKHCAVVSVSSTIDDQVEDYAIPVFSNTSVEFPECKLSNL